MSKKVDGLLLTGAGVTSVHQYVLYPLQRLRKLQAPFLIFLLLTVVDIRVNAVNKRTGSQEIARSVQVAFKTAVQNKAKNAAVIAACNMGAKRGFRIRQQRKRKVTFWSFAYIALSIEFILDWLSTNLFVEQLIARKIKN